METMTPEQLFWILGMGGTVTIVSTLYHERKAWLPWVLALWDRYVEVRWPASPDVLRGRRTSPAPEAAPPAPGTSGAPRAHAENDGAPGARTAPAPPAGDAALGELLPLIQRIAGHKLRLPDDGKTATGQALGIPKSGSSERWKAFSRAWDLLYPPPVANIVPADHPEAFIEDPRGNLRSVRPAVR